MRYVFDHDYHIHSKLSTCSRDEAQNAERILQYALDNGLKRICVTDHFWDSEVAGASDWYKPQNFEHITKILPLPKADGVDFMFGAETEMDKSFTIGATAKSIDKLDFIIVPTTHLNNVGFGIDEELAKSPEGRAKTWLLKVNALLDKKLPFLLMPAMLYIIEVSKASSLDNGTIMSLAAFAIKVFPQPTAPMSKIL